MRFTRARLRKATVVRHTRAPSTPEIEGVEVVRRAALSTTAVDVLEADGYLLGTPATTGPGWEKAAQHVLVTGEPAKADLEACWELGATVAAQLST